MLAHLCMASLFPLLDLHHYGAVKAMQQYHEKSGDMSLRDVNGFIDDSSLA